MFKVNLENRERPMNEGHNKRQPLLDTKWLSKKLEIAVDTIEKNRCYFPDLVPPHYRIFGLIRYDEDEVNEWLMTRLDKR
jgi:hypothetical protein